MELILLCRTSHKKKVGMGLLISMLLILLVVKTYHLKSYFETELTSQTLLGKECTCPRKKLKTLEEKNDPPDKESLSTCSEFSSLRGNGQKVFSFTFFENWTNSSKYMDIYGRDYLAGLKVNLDIVKTYYPGWVVRLYIRLLPNSNRWITLCQLVCDEPQLDICDIKEIPKFGNLSHMYPLLWRFLPMVDDQVDSFFVRDLDSMISERERSAIDQFLLQTDKDIHIMRDHPAHTEPIMGGMWGAKLDRLSTRTKFADAFSRLYRSPIFEASHLQAGHDQTALKMFVWPWAKPVAMSHDSYLCRRYLGAHPFPVQRKIGVGNFVGSTIELNGTIPFEHDYVCPLKCRPKNHKDWTYC